MKRNDAGLVHLRLVVRSGRAAQGSKPGVARLTAEQMRTGGGGKWSRGQVQDRLDELGSELVVQSALDATAFELRTTASGLEHGLSVLAAVVTQPRLSLGTLSRVRQWMTEEARERAETRADWTADAVLHREMYSLPTGFHPYAGWGATATELHAVTLADCQRWHRTHVTPSNTLLIAIGNVDTAAVTSAVKQAFGQWRGEVPTAPTYTDPMPPPRLQVHLVDLPRAPLSELRLGLLGPPLSSDSMPALEVALRVLGDRIGKSHGRTRVAIMPVRHGPCPIVISTRTSVTDTAVMAEAWLEELSGLTERAPEERELAAAAQLLSTELWSHTETSGGIARRIELADVHGRVDDYFDHRPQLWRGVDSQMVVAHARRWLPRDQAWLVVAGDARRVGATLSRFGTVHVLDPKQGLTIKQKIAHDPSADAAVQ